MFDSTKTKKKVLCEYSKVKERMDCRIILDKSEANRKIQEQQKKAKLQQSPQGTGWGILGAKETK